MKEPPFGCDRVPARYLAAWRPWIAQCPPDARPIDWEAAIYDCADLFSWWGAELNWICWPPGALFDVPYDGKPGGLAWFIRGDPVVALGPKRAFTKTRIFDRTAAMMSGPRRGRRDRYGTRQAPA